MSVRLGISFSWIKNTAIGRLAISLTRLARLSDAPSSYIRMSATRVPVIVGSAAFCGVGMFTMPLIAPWFLLLIGIAGVCFVLASERHQTARMILAVASATLVLANILPAPIVGALLTSLALTNRGGCLGLSAVILLLHTSGITTAEQLAANFLGEYGLETAAPGLIALTVTMVTFPRHAILILFAAAVTIAMARIATVLAVPPAAAMAIVAAPSMMMLGIVGAIMCIRGAAEGTQQSRSRISIGFLSIALLAGWAASPPRSGGPVFFLLPDAPGTFEASFFDGLDGALRYVGIDAQRAKSLDDVPTGATLLLPWVTAPLGPGGDDNIEAFRATARSKGLTVILAGEHTNYGDVATRINALVRGIALRRDTTVPPGNTDLAGPLRVSDSQAWPLVSMINRGASVSVQSPFARVVLAGDGWWGEPDLGEWLWVGDYVWSPGDRAGRLALAAVADDDGARWMVVGDNSLFIDRQLMADPRPVIRLLALASLWPAFLLDLVLLGLVSALIVIPSVWFASPAIAIAMTASIMAISFTPGLAENLVRNSPSDAWRASFVSPSSFNERSIAASLADEPRLHDSGWVFRVHGQARQGHIDSAPRQVEFLIVDVWVEVDGVRVSDCWRMGNLVVGSVTPPVTLMDAQACKVEGADEILVGSPASAAAFVVRGPKGPRVVLLDPAFLGLRAPPDNRAWLADIIERLNGNPLRAGTGG